MPSVALPVTIGSGGQSTKATVDAAAVAAAPTADVTFAYADGATEAKLRACTSLVVAAGGSIGYLRTPSWVIVTPATLADVIAAGEVCTVHYSEPDLFVDSVAPAPTPPVGRAWVTGDDILAHVGIDPASASPGDAAWAAACAAAVSGGIDDRMAGVEVLTTDHFPELTW